MDLFFFVLFFCPVNNSKRGVFFSLFLSHSGLACYWTKSARGDAFATPVKTVHKDEKNDTSLLRDHTAISKQNITITVEEEKRVCLMALKKGIEKIPKANTGLGLSACPDRVLTRLLCVRVDYASFLFYFSVSWLNV